jgi:hypothetical protein
MCSKSKQPISVQLCCEFYEEVEQIHMATLEIFVSLFQLGHRLHFDSFVCLFLSMSLFIFV